VNDQKKDFVLNFLKTLKKNTHYNSKSGFNPLYISSWTQ